MPCQCPNGVNEKDKLSILKAERVRLDGERKWQDYKNKVFKKWAELSSSEIGGETRLLQNNNNTNKKGDIMSWLVYKAKVVGTYTFIYAQKVWGLLPF